MATVEEEVKDQEAQNGEKTEMKETAQESEVLPEECKLSKNQQKRLKKMEMKEQWKTQKR